MPCRIKAKMLRCSRAFNIMTTQPSAIIDVAKKLHRYLLDVPDEPHEGIAICFTLIILSGIIVWWPKNKKMLKARLKVRTKKGFRWFVYDSHVSLGIYVALFLIIMSLTGPSWSFHWYRQGAMAVLGGNVNDMEHHGKVEMVQQPNDSINAEQAPQQIKHNPMHDGKKPPQAVLMELHTGKLLGLPMKIVYFIAALIGGFLPISGYYMWWKRRKAIKDAQKRLKEATGL